MIFLVAFLWGWSEATLFFIVPDILLTLLALRSLRTALVACVWASVGAIVGGAMTYDYANLHPASSREIHCSTATSAAPKPNSPASATAGRFSTTATTSMSTPAARPPEKR